MTKVSEKPTSDLGAGGIVAFSFDSQAIAIREDGYWNATQMCKIYGKKINDFLRLDSTKLYLEAWQEMNQNDDAGQSRIPNDDTASETGIPAGKVELVQMTRGGRDIQGSWVHPELALKLAAWLNPRFEVWVYQTIKKLLTQGEVKLKNELAGLQSALAQSEAQLNESQIQLEEASKELALTSHHLDQLRYERDELAEIARFNRENCWEAEIETEYLASDDDEGDGVLVIEAEVSDNSWENAF